MSHNDVHNVSDNAATSVATENAGIDFESQDLNIKAIVWFAIALLVIIIVSMVLIWGIMASMNGSAGTASPSALTVPPEPRLQPNPIDKTNSPTEMLHQEMFNQEEWLHSYGWVDKEAGMVHMPIDDAMELTVEEYGTKVGTE